MTINSVVLSIGFRPFFVAAIGYSVLVMSLWTGLWHGALNLPVMPYSASQWHAREMIYGYAFAVIAGFLLTAVRNWTGHDTLRGWPLAILVSGWGGARIALLLGPKFIVIACVLDCVFAVGLLVALARPLIRAKQWRQTGILAKIVLLASGNLLFYLGALGVLHRGIEWSIYGGLYVIIGLILTMGARILPGFIERGLDPTVTLRNPKMLSIATMLLFVSFFITELFIPNEGISALLALGLTAVTTLRLCLWHRLQIWRKPLLWGLYLAFVFVALGFAMIGLSPLLAISKMLGIHAFAVGAIGLATLSMMARVSLGHTGRNVTSPPRGIGFVLVLMGLAAVVRCLLPAIDYEHYGLWIGISQILWISSFGLFALRYLPILFLPRVDGEIA